MARFTSRHLRADCACTPESAPGRPGPTLGNERGKILPLHLLRTNASVECRLPRGDGGSVDARQAVHQHHVLVRLRLLERAVSDRGAQRRSRHGVDVRPRQQHGRRVRRRTAG